MSLVSVSQFAGLACGLVLATAPALAQLPPPAEPKHLTQDWSDRHFFFPGTKDVSTQLKNAQNPAYQKQQDTRNAKARGFDDYKAPNPLLIPLSPSGGSNQDEADFDASDSAGGASLFATASINPGAEFAKAKKKKPPVKPQGDWSFSLGPTSASTVAPHQFPAKFNFDINSAPSCTADFVVFTENVTGGAGLAATKASALITYNGFTTLSPGITITNGSTTLNLTGVATASTSCSGAGPTYSVNYNNSGSDLNVEAASFAAVVNACNTFAPAIGVTATAAGSGGNVTVFAATAGSAGNNITVTVFTTLASINGNPGVNGSGTTNNLSGGTDATAQPSIVGVNNLYTGAAATASITGTFSGNAGSGTVVITNPAGPTTKTFTGGPAAAASSIGTFTNTLTSGTITIGSLTMTANNGSSASATGTGSFSGQPVNGSITITNGGNTLTVTPNVGTLTITGRPGSSGDTFAIAGTTYRFESTPSQQNDVSRTSSGGPYTNAQYAMNINAAIHSDKTLCGTLQTLNGVSNTCFWSTTVANASVTTALGTGANTNVLAVTNTTGASIPFTMSSSNVTNSTGGANITSGGASTCTGNTAGTFAVNALNSTMATNVASAIQACASHTTTGVTAAAVGAAVNLTAATAGTAGNNIAIGSTLLTLGAPSVSAFSWTTGTLTGGQSANSCTSATVGVFTQSATGTTAATNFATALRDASCAAALAAVGISAPALPGAAAVTITASSTGATGNSITTGGSATGFSWTGGDVTHTHLSGGFPALSTDFATLGTTGTEATNLQAAINANLTGLGIVATTVNGSVITVTASSSGSASNAISVSTTFSSGFAWASSNLAGGADIGACNPNNGGLPHVIWAYDTHTGSGGPVPNSPVLSLDGTKVAFIESRTSGGSVLHVLRPKAPSLVSNEGTVAAPVAPTTVILSTSGTAAADWATCLATANSCMFNLVFNATTSSNSSLFPNYQGTTDTGYVGDDGGRLWKFTGLFKGTPALATTGSWSTGLSNGAATSHLTGPVLDYSNLNIYAGDSLGGMNYFTDAGAFGGRVAPSGTTFTAIADPPGVDSGDGLVVFVGVNSTATNPRVIQVSTTLTGAVTATLGTSATTQIHMGAWDDLFFNSGSGGHMYVCGHDGGGLNHPTLYRIAFSNAGVMTGSNDGSSLGLGTGTGECSPLTEIKNGAKDWLFVGIPSNCAFGGSATGCIEAFDITSAFPTAAVATGSEPGGTSGIVVDNVSASGHASSLYFSTLGVAACDTGGSAGGCATQRTQSGVQ